MSRDAYDREIAEPSERDDDDEFELEIDSPPEPAPSWDILERHDFEWDARMRRIIRRLVVWDIIRATTIAMAVMLGIALAGSVFYSICPEPVDVLIARVTAHKELADDLIDFDDEAAARRGGFID